MNEGAAIQEPSQLEMNEESDSEKLTKELLDEFVQKLTSNS